MTYLTPRLAMLIWLFLMAATLGSAWLAEHHAFAGHLTAVFVMLVAFFKGRAVMLYFMELRGAPLAWRMVFEVWGIVSTLVIVGLWTLTGSGG